MANDLMPPDLDAFLNELQALESRTRFPRETLDAVAHLARGFMQQNHFERAYQYYGLLTFFDPVDPQFLTGQALCARELGRTEEALLLFDFATCIDPHQPLPALLAAECLMQLNRVDEARQLLPAVVRFCCENPQHEPIGERAKAILEVASHSNH